MEGQIADLCFGGTFFDEIARKRSEGYAVSFSVLNGKAALGGDGIPVPIGCPSH